MAIKELSYGILVCFLVFGLTGFNPLGYIRSNEPVDAGRELEIHVNLNNDLGDDLDNVRVKAHFLDFDEFLYSSNLELNEGEKISTWLFWDVPSYIPADDYLVRIVTYGDGDDGSFKDVDYTWVSVY